MIVTSQRATMLLVHNDRMAVVRLSDPKLKTLGERDIECIFVGYDEHSKAFRTEDFGGSMVPEEATNEVVQQPDFEIRKIKRHRTPKDFGPEFQLYFIEGTRDEVSDEHSYCFNVEDDPKTFDEAIFKRKLKIDETIEKFKERLVIGGFKQKSGIDYFDTYVPVECISTIRPLIAMTSIHNLIIHQMDVKTTFLNGELDEEFYMNQPQGFILPGNENKVDLTKEFLPLWFSMKDMREGNVILGIKIKHEMSTPMDTSEKLMPNNDQAVSQLEYSRVIRPNVCNDLYKVFLLGSGVISLAFKIQTCITVSTMEYEFVALAAAGKKAEWLKNFLFEISLWSKPETPFS
uniref:Reverse transcriptase Ty1/copia-type domain-containing protein n=1 Tax=Tanacetum cinerariifolium TaxID=118510 RepID=A0A699HYR3_TANCI|nr:hypothetical protein [Tanacetum cinerariifolium]